MQERQVTIGDKTYPLPTPSSSLQRRTPSTRKEPTSFPKLSSNVSCSRFTSTTRHATKSARSSTSWRRPLPRQKPSRSRSKNSYREPRARQPGLRRWQHQNYIVEIVQSTRDPLGIDPALHNLIRVGASPRGTINLTLAARAVAFLNGRGFVVPQDIKNLAYDVLRHRILLTYEAEAESVTTEEIIKKIIDRIPVP